MIALPPKREQLEIESNLNDHLKELRLLAHQAQQSVDLLQERRTALISAAVTGKIDVRHLASQEAA